MGGVVLEICVDDLAGVSAAAEGGADRIELCGALPLGGLTPSPAFAEAALQSGVAIHAMVRPRAGDFVYSPGEVELMLAEIRDLAAVGVAGVVVGATHEDGSPCRDSLARFRDAAVGLDLVLHRAIDLAPDPCEAVDLACSLGFDWVLSSGGARTAPEGAAVLSRMVEVAAGRLGIIAGGGLTPNNLVRVVSLTGAGAVHASARSSRVWRDPRIETFGFALDPSSFTDRDKVAAIRAGLAQRLIDTNL